MNVMMRLRSCIAAIPYTKNPQTDPEFRIFFSKEWYQALHLSVRNFFSEIFNATHILHSIFSLLFYVYGVIVDS